MKSQQIVAVRGKTYFVCDYTGGPCSTRYYIPSGKQKRGKKGCYATLPILLRHQLELNGGRMDAKHEKLKAKLEAFYVQPDIPLQPPLEPSRVPLSEDELLHYLGELDMGMAWLRVPKGQTVESLLRPSKKRHKSDEN